MSLVNDKVIISLATAISLFALRRMALKWSLIYFNKLRHSEVGEACDSYTCDPE